MSEHQASWFASVVLVVICLGGSVGLSHLVNSGVKQDQQKLRHDFDDRLPRIESLEKGVAELNSKIDFKLEVAPKDVKASGEAEAEATRELIRSEFRSLKSSMELGK